jgi:hypothetical protein
LNSPVPTKTPRGEIKIHDPIIEPTNNALPLIKLSLGFSGVELISLSFFFTILFNIKFRIKAT